MKKLYSLAIFTALATGVAAPASAQSGPAQADAGNGNGPPSSANGPAAPTTIGNGDIVVTAEKRAERLIDVPISLTQINAQSLVAQGLPSIRDFFSRVPGLQYEGGAGETVLAIRGVAADIGGNPTVGVTIDDVPFGSATGNANGGLLSPDLDPAILRDIEVLRGPQGTLYGANSLGGLVKYQTIEPTTTKLSGAFETGADVVLNGGSGYNARGALNIPVIDDVLGVSLSGFYRRDPGYIDYTALQGGAQKDANHSRNYGGRAAVLIKPTDGLKINLGFLDQETHGQGGTDIALDVDYRPDAGTNVNNYSKTLPIYYDRARLYSARIDADLGFATLSSITGYAQNRYDLTNDLTYIFAPVLRLVQKYFGDPVGDDRALLVESFGTNRFSQEARLASTGHHRLEWLAGVYYTHESSNSNQTLNAIDPASGGTDLVVFTSPSPSTYREISGYGDVTYHLTDRLSLQGGVRYASNHQGYTQTASGPLAELEGAGNSSATSRDHAWTWLASPQYKLSHDLNLYARVATGYRPGGPNSSLTPNNLTYGPDRTTNYEVGIKGSVLDRKLIFSGDLFWIDWKDIQLLSIDSTTQINFTENGGRARSRGAEVEVSSSPWRGVVLAANGTYIDATLRNDLDGQTVGQAGDRLPLSSKWSGNLSADQTIKLSPGLDANFGASLSYVGPHYSEFPTAGLPRGYSQGYTTIDLRAGWKAHGIVYSMYVRNLTDSHGITYVSTSGSPFVGSIVRPRTVGLQLGFSF